MKTPSTELFDLIRSLTKQEKRYYKMYTTLSGGKTNKYLLLFDAIDAQNEYDEQKLKKKFKDEAFVRQFHVIKNYLYGLILKSLRNYHANSAEDKYHSLLRDAQILYDKGLQKQSGKLLAKAKRTAEKDERFLQLLDIHRWEHLIIHQENNTDRLETYISEEVQEEMKLIERYQDLLRFQLLNDKYFIRYWRSGIARDKEQREAYNSLMDEPFYEDENAPLSVESRFYQLNAHYTRYFCTGQLQQAHDSIAKAAELLDAEDPDKKRYLAKYISALNNLYIVQKELAKPDEALKTLRQLRNVPVDSLTHKAEHFMRSYILELDLQISTGRFTDALEDIGTIEEDYDSFKKHIDKQSRLAFFYNFSYVYFGAGRFHRALIWNNLLLNDRDLSIREDIHCFGRILNLIIHYEIGNDDLLEYAVRSTYRFLYKRKRLFKVEGVILEFLKKYPNWVDREQIIEGFSELHKKLLVFQHDDFEKHAFEYFDFISWLESKIQKEKFEIVKQRNMQL